MSELAERRFWVPGNPVTKGSKSIGAHGQMYERTGVRLQAWLDAVATAAMVNRRGLRVDWPCGITLNFAIGERDMDLDKLERAVWDGLVNGRLLVDDKYIVESHARKTRGALPEKRGCDVHLYRVAA